MTCSGNNLKTRRITNKHRVNKWRFNTIKLHCRLRKYTYFEHCLNFERHKMRPYQIAEYFVSASWPVNKHRLSPFQWNYTDRKFTLKGELCRKKIHIHPRLNRRHPWNPGVAYLHREDWWLIKKYALWRRKREFTVNKRGFLKVRLQYRESDVLLVLRVSLFNCKINRSWRRCFSG